MKICYIVITSFLLSSCSGINNSKKDGEDNYIKNEEIRADFQSIIDSAEVIGSILIYDTKEKIYYSNNFGWSNKGHLPASTFKIANSILALENNLVANDSTILKWDGKKKLYKSWEQDLIFRDAFHYSCVPCYQELARKLGEQKMNEYLSKLNYGNIIVDSTNIDNFWLEGESRISQFQQIDFLNRFYNSYLPISNRTKEIMERMMVIEENKDYKLSGKTGWSVTDDIDNGWFVGYVVSKSDSYLFATNIEPKPPLDVNRFIKIRKEITFEALYMLDNNLAF